MVLNALIDELATCQVYGYHSDGIAASEPTALAALALASGQELAAARACLTWLANVQSTSGSIGVTEQEPQPTWPTSLAIIAWREYRRLSGDDQFREKVARAHGWLLSIEGHTQKRPAPTSHDTMLKGWPWVAGTHSWLEPTAFSILALNATGDAAHPRSREAVKLLLDRQIPGGGCNYGNTFVLDQKLMPHVQPTGVAMLTLANQSSDPRVQLSLRYLERQWPTAVGIPSLCFAAMGLTAHDRTPHDLAPRLEKSRAISVLQPSGYSLALLTLASMTDTNPLVQVAKQKAEPVQRPAANIPAQVPA